MCCGNDLKTFWRKPSFYSSPYEPAKVELKGKANETIPESIDNSSTIDVYEFAERLSSKFGAESSLNMVFALDAADGSEDGCVEISYEGINSSVIEEVLQMSISDSSLLFIDWAATAPVLGSAAGSEIGSRVENSDVVVPEAPEMGDNSWCVGVCRTMGASMMGMGARDHAYTIKYSCDCN
jgi:hypothetical protein